MKNNKHSYFKDDIRKMLFLYAIIPVFLLSLVCVVIFWETWHYSMEKTNKTNNKDIITDLETTILAYTEVIDELIQQENIIDGKIDVSSRVQIFERIYGISNKLDRKANLYIFDRNLNSIISATKDLPEFLDGDYFINWGVFRNMNQNPDRVALKLVEDTASDSVQLVIGKPIIRKNTIKGYVVFVLDSKQFAIKLSKFGSQTVITDEYGWVYVSNNYDFLNTLQRFDLRGQKANGNIENEVGKYFITSNSILDNRIHIYSISSRSNIASIFKYIIVILIFVFVMITLLVFISTKKMAASKTKDLYKIIRAFEKVKEGNLDTYIEISGNDEFKIIGESYNLMLDSLKEQIENNKEMGKLVSSSQSKQLESQFNPHFLYNTLENIRFMCKLDSTLASDMIFSLSTLLRYSISNTREEVTVKEDVHYTENYMSILKYRFNRRFHYTMDIPSDVMSCIIPKLILQPLIENSIKYGFEGKEQLTVKISAYMEGNNLIMTCWDDGSGMSEKELEEMKQLLLQKTNKSNHFGLFNIHRRVQLKYGDEYGIQIESKQGTGTYLKVVMPIKYEDNRGGLDVENYHS
ncbi:histidine kinase/DNA gyrase B/HSP90-like ATPase [Mobilisporobacter senegalensis]|uniref:histidine kinase n=1 Tax=Mobilisporobacter senegalensis TaxID=1329262 RepID=A0A3N1XV98_9FIRM|nr:histidine kinase [Mobilisporobacter senegalensis]ROR30526.1 histidine kinase/DNA gyrase B/HSP90-like ATPase [Mobilisporobacter senegalensis]